MDGVIVNLSVLVNLIRKMFVEGHKDGSRLTREGEIGIHGGCLLIYHKSVNILNSFYTRFCVECIFKKVFYLFILVVIRTTPLGMVLTLEPSG